MSQSDKQEIIRTRQVQDDIKCKTCGIQDDGTLFTNDYRKGCCQAYQYPDHKPMDVLRGGDCPYYKAGK